MKCVLTVEETVYRQLTLFKETGIVSLRWKISVRFSDTAGNLFSLPRPDWLWGAPSLVPNRRRNGITRGAFTSAGLLPSRRGECSATAPCQNGNNSPAFTFDFAVKLQLAT
jgi:hypothetical protein